MPSPTVYAARPAPIPPRRECIVFGSRQPDAPTSWKKDMRVVSKKNGCVAYGEGNGWSERKMASHLVDDTLRSPSCRRRAPQAVERAVRPLRREQGAEHARRRLQMPRGRGGSGAVRPWLGMPCCSRQRHSRRMQQHSEQRRALDLLQLRVRVRLGGVHQVVLQHGRTAGRAALSSLARGWRRVETRTTGESLQRRARAERGRDHSWWSDARLWRAAAQLRCPLSHSPRPRLRATRIWTAMLP